MDESTEYYRRRLPHYQPLRATFFVTFRLADSLPEKVIVELMRERRIREMAVAKQTDSKKKQFLLDEERKRYFGKFDHWLDNASTGPKWLAQDEIASIVAEAIRHRDGKEYDLLAYCIMSNHVHMLIELDEKDASNVLRASARRGTMEQRRTEVRPTSTYALTAILRMIKGSTARECNKLLARTGSFWHHESYDHVVRNSGELEKILWYVIQNPVKAGLCNDWQDWKWTYLKNGLIEIS